MEVAKTETTHRNFKDSLKPIKLNYRRLKPNMENETNLSFIDIETGLKDCLNKRLNKPNINQIKTYINNLNTKPFSFTLLSVNYLQKLVNGYNNLYRNTRINRVINKGEFKKVYKNRYTTEFKGNGILKSKKRICFITL